MPAPSFSQFDDRTREPSFALGERDKGSPTNNVARRRTPVSRRRHGARARNYLGSVGSLAFVLTLAAALVVGWRNSEEGHLTPETGVGYWLGIAGASAMVLLLLYPLRKRMKLLRSFGTVSAWFRLHMILGLVGPTLILFHSNFTLGSFNSNVALFSMLVVASSGLIGRYLHSRVHMGLYGRRAKIDELLVDVANLKNAVEGGPPPLDELVSALDAYAARAILGRSGAASSFFALIGLCLRSPGQRVRLLHEAERCIALEGKQRGWPRRVKRKRVRELRRLLRQYFAAVNKAAAFAFCERLFALWHVLHLPLFVLLVLAAIVHVLAVHLY